MASTPRRFCFVGSELIMYENYGLLTLSMDDSNPGGDSVVLADDIQFSGTGFTTSLNSETRNSVVNIQFTLDGGKDSVTLDQEIFIRNVP